MGKTFEHYILTRFNLSFFEGVNQSNCSEEYLSYRFDLFEKYCLPSIKGQTCQNFKWLVLFDTNTPEQFKRRIATHQGLYPNLIPCYLDIKDYVEIPAEYLELSDRYEDTLVRKQPDNPYDLQSERIMRLVLPLFLMDAIRKCSSEVPEFYVTTRIDNDDAFHKDMVKTIQQKMADIEDSRVLDFVYSYKYILQKGIVYRYPLYNNHFITLIEPSKNQFQSVLYGNHLFIDEFFPTEHMIEHPFQVELIHGGNVVNDFTELSIRGLLYAVLFFKKRDFGYHNVKLSVRNYLHVLLFLIKTRLKCRF